MWKKLLLATSLLFLVACNKINPELMLENGIQGVANLTEAVVSYVIDGDTFVLESGEKVRLIGIDTPERNEPGFDEASNFTRNLVKGQTVWLEADGNNTDPHGRLRRYVWLEVPADTENPEEIKSKMLNAKLLSEGYARVLIVGEVRKEQLFRSLEH